MFEDLDALSGKLGLDFRDRSLLFQSLVHRSYLNENPGTHLRSNERLEFLGDAVLDALAAEFLFLRYPDKGEGELTLWRSALVRTETLAGFAAQLELGRYLVMGRGEEADGGRVRPTILADAFEAVVGAIYLDGGIEAARAFFTPFMEEAMTSLADRMPIDYKSALQIEIQGRIGITPQYRTADAWGPDHARVFRVEVWAGDHLLGQGEGLSKQAAQQEAARAALEQLPSVEGSSPVEILKTPRARRPAADTAEEPPEGRRARRPAADTAEEPPKGRRARKVGTPGQTSRSGKQEEESA